MQDGDMKCQTDVRYLSQGDGRDVPQIEDEWNVKQ